ncbi:hypothetical protein HGA88_06940 [Candidatus Roizmanbacteria bacterium]|nr:hypothetical protein [Candidatus Roizmanbacteria bacterium]
MENKVSIILDELDPQRAFIRSEYDPERYFYTVSWRTELSEDTLIKAIEKTICYYEARFPDGIMGINGVNVQTNVTDIPPGTKGVIYSFIEDGIEKWGDVPYTRPIDWSRVQEQANGCTIATARFLSPIGDFCIMPLEKGPNIGIVSRIIDSSGYRKLMKDTNRRITDKLTGKIFEELYSSVPSKE